MNFPTNELKEAFDLMVRTARAYMDACTRYGDDPTPANEETARRAGAVAEEAAEKYAAMRGE